MKLPTNISTLFADKEVVNICAPMVRYSKLQFRTLVRMHNVDLCFTPMIMADSFCQSEKARNNEFTTDAGDSPLIVQFASKTVHDFVSASEMIYPYADGVDLNCGCPQRWAIQDGYGCALLSQPELIKDMVRQLRSKFSNPFSISVKIRLLPNIIQTVELCRQLEHCGVTFITIHGRTPTQKSEPVDVDAFVEVKKSISIPLVVNGDLKCLDDVKMMTAKTKCNGVMTARGILCNPSLFDGTNTTGLDVVQEWLSICNMAGDDISFQTFHHHLVFMLEKLLPKKCRPHFNSLTTKSQVFNYLEESFGVTPQNTIEQHLFKPIPCHYDDLGYRSFKLRNICEKCGATNTNCVCSRAIYNVQGNGKYFEEIISNENFCDLDYMDSSLFDV